MEQSLHRVKEDAARAQRDTKTFDSFHHSVDHMGRDLEDIGEQVIEQMLECVLAAHVCNAEREMLDRR